MAIIKYGHLIAEARGKLNGTVFSRNTYGAYMRTKVTPANPQTSFQVAVRSNFTAGAQAWAGLTVAQRLAWNTQAVNFSRTNIFGDNIPLTGFNLYMRLFRNAGIVGGTPRTTPPLPQEVTYLQSLSIAAAAGAGTLAMTFVASAVGDESQLVIQATPQYSPGITFVKNLFRQLTVAPDSETSPFALGTLYEARFGDLVAGQKISVRVYGIHGATFLSSLPLEASAIVAA
jgi:hypothetical protein